MGRGGVVRPEVRLGRPGGGWLGADLGAFSAIKIRVDPWPDLRRGYDLRVKSPPCAAPVRGVH